MIVEGVERRIIDLKDAARDIEDVRDTVTGLQRYELSEMVQRRLKELKSEIDDVLFWMDISLKDLLTGQGDD